MGATNTLNHFLKYESSRYYLVGVDIPLCLGRDLPLFRRKFKTIKRCRRNIRRGIGCFFLKRDVFLSENCGIRSGITKLFFYLV
jgi:hypothetical protein